MTFWRRLRRYLRGGPHGQHKQTFRPMLELLEDRLAPAGAPFVEPPVIMSNPLTHVLSATLTMGVTPAQVGDTRVTNAWTYNGSYAGPTLKAQPGDLLDLVLVNRLPTGQVTNLHTHGLHVSPLGNTDNVLLEIKPGQSNHFQIQIPTDHPNGLYWYHPHHHGKVFDQLSMGLSGLLVIGDADGGANELASYTSRLLVLKNALLSGNTIRIPTGTSLPTSPIQTFTVNGQINPVLDVPSNQWQVFNLANMGANAFYSLQLNTQPDGTGTSIPLFLVGMDGNPFYGVNSFPGTGAGTNALGVPPGRRWSFTFKPGNAGQTYYLIGISNPAQVGTNPSDLWPNVAAAKVRTTLSNAINAAQRTITVASASGFPTVNGYKIHVGGETMMVTAGAGTTSWTVTRGASGTRAAAHSSGALVSLAATTTLTAPVTASQTTISVPAGAAANFPSADPTQQTTFTILVGSEYMTVTDTTLGTTWTVTRGSNGSTAAPHQAGNLVSYPLTGYPLMTINFTPPLGTDDPPVNAPTQLNGAINASTTSITVASAAGFPATTPFTIHVDNENMTVTATSGNNWTVVRGVGGTTATSHNNNASVSLALTYGHPPETFDDLALVPTAQIAEFRKVVFGEDGMIDTINGLPFPSNPLFQPRLDTVEEWTLLNPTSQAHPFHLHTNPQQVVSGGNSRLKNYQDVINVPAAAAITQLAADIDASQTTITVASTANFPTATPFTIYIGDESLQVTAVSGTTWTVTRATNGTTAASHSSGADVVNGPGQVVIRIRFTKYLGDIVFHCHRVDHEDMGMMTHVNMIPNAPYYAVGSNSGSPPRVAVYNSVTGNLVVPEFLAFSPTFVGGVNVAAGDVNGDGVDDIIVGMGGGGSTIKVIDGTKLGEVFNGEILPSALIGEFDAFGPSYTAGVFVAAGDLNSDGLADVIVGTGASSTPQVLVVDATRIPQGGVIDPMALLGKRLLTSHYKGGVRVAAGDIAGNGRTQIVVAAGPGSYPFVQVLNQRLAVLASFLAFESGFRGGVFVATGNTAGCHFDNIIAGKGPGGDPLVNIFSNESHTGALSMRKIDSFLAYGAGDTGGVRVTSRHNVPAPSNINANNLVAPFGGNWDDVVTSHATGQEGPPAVFDRHDEDCACCTGVSSTMGGPVPPAPNRRSLTR